MHNEENKEPLKLSGKHKIEVVYHIYHTYQDRKINMVIITIDIDNSVLHTKERRGKSE